MRCMEQYGKNVLLWWWNGGLRSPILFLKDSDPDVQYKWKFDTKVIEDLRHDGSPIVLGDICIGPSKL